jgi:hypothetical protein
MVIESIFSKRDRKEVRIMTGIDERLKGLMGVGVMVLLGLQLYANREEEMGMKLTILIIIAVLGLVIPLFWLIGTATGFTYFGLHRVAKPAKSRRPPSIPNWVSPWPMAVIRSTKRRRSEM